MAYTEEEMRQRTAHQLEATRFAMFFFSWILAYGRCPETSVPPSEGEVDDVVRKAVRQFKGNGRATIDNLRTYLDITARATHANYYWHHVDIWAFAANKVQNLVDEELGTPSPDRYRPQD